MHGRVPFLKRWLTVQAQKKADKAKRKFDAEIEREEAGLGKAPRRALTAEERAEAEQCALPLPWGSSCAQPTAPSHAHWSVGWLLPSAPDVPGCPGTGRSGASTFPRRATSRASWQRPQRGRRGARWTRSMASACCACERRVRLGQEQRSDPT